jgi:major intracellular serine protease
MMITSNLEGKSQLQLFQTKLKSYFSSEYIDELLNDKQQGYSLFDQLKTIDSNQVTHKVPVPGIPRIWSETQGEGVKVAVLDTGIDTDHRDLTNALIDSQDFTGKGIEDQNGHGTHCAGIIAAYSDHKGLIGIAPKAKLLIGKVLDQDGKGELENIVQGINWAVEKKANIISISFGGNYSSNELHKAIHHALAEGVFVICAAGNQGSLYQSNISYPARYGGVITIAAHDQNGHPLGSSSRGGELDFIAPGDEVFSTYKDGGYAKLTGTSMAASWVAGLAALIKSKHNYTPNNETPLENNEDLREHLLRMASHPGSHDNETGYGGLIALENFLDFEILAKPCNSLCNSDEVCCNGKCKKIKLC